MTDVLTPGRVVRSSLGVTFLIAVRSRGPFLSTTAGRGGRRPEYMGDENGFTEVKQSSAFWQFDTGGGELRYRHALLLHQ